MAYFIYAKGSDLVEKFFEIEGVCEEMRDAGMDVDNQAVYSIYVAALLFEVVLGGKGSGMNTIKYIVLGGKGSGMNTI